jgi:Tfp pilus assembly protein PilF
VTLPLWSDDTRLWQWDAMANPGSYTAKNNLLANYIDRHDHVHAREIADVLLADENPCASCMVNVAAAAMEDGDVARARTAIAKAEKALTDLPYDPPASLLQSFILVTARLRELEHDAVGADDAYHDAITMGPLNPQAHMAFALFLARQGKATQARAAMDETLPLLSPDMREERRQYFERALAEAMQPAQPAPVRQP